MNQYTDQFYKLQEGGTAGAAEWILNEVFDRHSDIQSVVDVGCGKGVWLAEVLRRGVDQILGLDGPWVNADTLAFTPDRFRKVDLNGDFGVDKKYDLAISLEVAEHLRPECAEQFVAQLTQLSDRVLFSAAIPGQGGTHHYNEQWQSYWAKLFASHGFVMQDFIRPLIWNESEVPAYYRQNILFFSREGTANLEGAPVPMPVDVVHPFYLKKACTPCIKESLRLLARAVKRRVQR